MGDIRDDDQKEVVCVRGSNNVPRVLMGTGRFLDLGLAQRG